MMDTQRPDRTAARIRLAADALSTSYRQGLDDAAAIAERIRAERHDLCATEEDEVELEVLSGQAFIARVILQAIESLKDNPNEHLRNVP